MISQREPVRVLLGHCSIIAREVEKEKSSKKKISSQVSHKLKSPQAISRKSELSITNSSKSAVKVTH